MGGKMRSLLACAAQYIFILMFFLYLISDIAN